MGMLNKRHVYSYSQLSQFADCPYSFYLERIEENELGLTRLQAGEVEENAFSQYGTLMHSLIERWANKELTKEQMINAWKEEYPNCVIEKWPKFLASKGYAKKAYEDGLKYLENFDEFPGYTIIAAEEKFKTTIAGRPFVGVIDLLLKDNETGKIIIMDHKSKSKSTFKKSADSMYKQILLYSKHVKEAYGQFPDIMRFNLFKECAYDSRDFNKRDYEQTLKWAEEIIEKIENFDIIDWFEAKNKDFFCENICSVRKFCENGK